MKRNTAAAWLLLGALATGTAYATVELMPRPPHAAPAPVVTTTDPTPDPVARPAMPVPAVDAPPSATQPQLGPPAPTRAPQATDGTDAGLVTEPAPQVIPIPGGVTPVPEAPRPVDSPVHVDPGPACLMAGCPPVADDSGVGQLICDDGEEPQGEFGCVATQLPGESAGRVAG